MSVKPVVFGDLLAGDWVVHATCPVCGAYSEVDVAALSVRCGSDQPLPPDATIDCPACGSPDAQMILISADALRD